MDDGWRAISWWSLLDSKKSTKTIPILLPFCPKVPRLRLFIPFYHTLQSACSPPQPVTTSFFMISANRKICSAKYVSKSFCGKCLQYLFLDYLCLVWSILLAATMPFMLQVRTKLTLVSEAMTWLPRKLHLSDFLSEFTALKFSLRQPRDKYPLIGAYASGLSFPFMSTGDDGLYTYPTFHGWDTLLWITAAHSSGNWTGQWRWEEYPLAFLEQGSLSYTPEEREGSRHCFS